MDNILSNALSPELMVSFLCASNPAEMKIRSGLKVIKRGNTSSLRGTQREGEEKRKEEGRKVGREMEGRRRRE